MRELRLKYVIQMVSDIAGKAKTDERALTMAQEAVQKALKKTNEEAGLLERVLLRVARVGSRSADEQAAAIARLAMRYQDLRKHAEGAEKAMTKAAQVGAGVVAGAYAVDRMTRAPMDYSLRLAHMANTAYADRGVSGRIEGKRTLNAAIEAAVRTGGGSRDDAAGALDALIASGAVSVRDAMLMLPSTMKAATASGGTANDMAMIGLRSIQSFGIKREQLPEVYNMAMVAGQQGGFELRDMSKWLPQAMAAGRISGLSGMEGLRRIMASMQASVITAGTKDEAGNNVVNLLGKINSQDTANDVKKIDKEMRARGQSFLGVDLPTYLADERSRGVNSMDAFMSLIERVAAQNPEYVKLQKQLQGASPGDRQATLQSMADVLQGSAIGKVLQDRQATMAAVAEMNNKGYVKSVMEATRSNNGALDTSFAVIEQETSFARQRALNEAAFGAQKAFDAAAPALNAVANTAADAAVKFPTLTAAVVGATAAATAFAAALGASSLIGLLKNAPGGAGPGIAQKVLSGGTGAAVAAASTWAAGTFNALRTVLRKNPWLAVAGDMFFTSDNDIRLLRDAEARRTGYRGKGFDDPRRFDRVGGSQVPFAQLPDMGAASADLAGAGAMSLGQGTLEVKVNVADDRSTASLRVDKPLPTIRIQSGDTNPAGY